LVLSCSRCNGFDFKASKNYVAVVDNNYSDMGFEIVHPHIDDITDHLTNLSDIVIRVNNASRQGQKTIDEFKINDEDMVVLRGCYLKTKLLPVRADDETLLDEILQRTYTAQ